MTAVVVHDLAAERLRQFFTPDRVLAAERRSRSEVITEAAALRQSLNLREKRLGPPEASSLLIALRTALENQARRQATAYGSYQWLWYLRRVPDFLTEGR